MKVSRSCAFADGILIVAQELADVNTNPPTGCSIKLPKEDDIFLWEVLMEGPSDSIYAVSLAVLTYMQVY